ncbi:MAG: aminodeoxychorismate/anthranilate synthase component II [Chitinophagales bacterium]|nr:aminodeoxychorismate/anthranilate synthase component II [Bacteroidota bacterium]MCB9042462.1 aminodeoxychorismate/anthranilate synthase component II [Chitinophagales bacterium]
MSLRILLLDNFDSFTYNLVNYFLQLNASVQLVRNDISPETHSPHAYDLLVLSPGPGTPSQAGFLLQYLQHFHTQLPILGVCLGHQAIVEFFGGTLQQLTPVHGKPEQLQHNEKGIYAQFPQHIQVGRYHSLAAEQLPACLEATAWASSDGAIMSVRHHYLPIVGVQYHPESVLSMENKVGMRILENVLAQCKAAVK